MDLGFTKDDLLGDVAEWMRAEQGDGFKKTLFYDIEKKAGHPVTTSDNWYDARNLLGFYEWLTMAAAYGPAFANPSLARLGFKLVPLDAGEVDTSQLAAIKADLDALSAQIQAAMDGASKPKLKAVK